MKPIVILFFLIPCFGLTAQNRWYMVGGPDSYKFLNIPDFYINASGYGLHYGVQFFIPSKKKFIYWGIEAICQYRRQITYYEEDNPDLNFTPSRNFQINPFIRLGSGPLFFDAGGFLNLRFDITGTEYYTPTASPTDFGLASAVGARVGITTFALKTAYGLNDPRYQKGKIYYIGDHLHSFNLSLETAICLNPARSKS